MLSLIRTDGRNEEFNELIGLLDQQLRERNGDMQSKYDKFNVVLSVGTAVVARWNGQPAGCGCFKQFDKEAVEIKRMFECHVYVTVKAQNRDASVIFA